MEQRTDSLGPSPAPGDRVAGRLRRLRHRYAASCGTPPAASRSRWTRGVLGLLLAGLGVIGWLRAQTVELRTELVGGNLPVNGSATDPLDVTAHNSPAAVVNPKDRANLAVASRIDRPQFSCALHVSHDGGATWAPAPIPRVEDAEVPCFAPDAAFSTDGTLYVAFTSAGVVAGAGNVPNAVWVAASSDGGRSFSLPVRASGSFAYQLRLAADPSTPGRLWVTWLESPQSHRWGFIDDGYPIVVSRSDDGGRSWHPPVRISPTSRRQAVAPVLAAGGDALYAAYLDLGRDPINYNGAHEGKGGPPSAGTWTLVVSRSSDGGMTWTETVAGSVVPGHRFLMLFPPTPALAVDGQRGRVYVAFTDALAGDSDVVVWASADRGRRWSPLRRLGVGPHGPPDGRTQNLPQLAVAPGGRLDVVYYDRRGDPDDSHNHVSLQSSTDGGRSFGAPVPLSERPFDARIGFGAERGLPELGSRLGLVSTDDGALAMWADTRSALPLTVKQDLARAVVAFREQPPWALRPAAAATVALGTIVALSGACKRGPRRSREPHDIEGVLPTPEGREA